MEKISLGTRVAIRATKFDPKDSDNSWSRCYFGDNFSTALCWGTVTAKNNDKISIVWDIDSKTTKVRFQDLDKIEKGM